MRRSAVLLAIGVALLAGCAAGLRYEQVGPTYPPRGSTSDVQIIERGEPSRPYERLGQITWDYERNKFDPPRLAEILPDLKQKTWEAGGDALIVRKLEEPPTNPRGTLRLIADVVRWKP